MSKETIWKKLCATGLPKAGVAALMGNMEAESNCESVRVQGDFGEFRTMSNSYADQVDRGMISRAQFCGDAKGWGLCQWTYGTRKGRLYDMARAAGKSIGDEDVQLALLCEELCGEYSQVLDALRTCVSPQDIRAASDMVVTRFERPADQSEGAKAARAQMGMKIWNEFMALELQNADTGANPQQAFESNVSGNTQTEAAAAAMAGHCGNVLYPDGTPVFTAQAGAGEGAPVVSQMPTYDTELQDPETGESYSVTLTGKEVADLQMTANVANELAGIAEGLAGIAESLAGIAEGLERQNALLERQNALLAALINERTGI